MNIGVWLDFLRGGSMNFDPKKVVVLGAVLARTAWLRILLRVILW